MSLTPGQLLSQYEILAKLGEGGMGEVWRARDTRLDREVAIKVLPAELASDAERLRRFEREARTLAQLNHPNVAGIHGIERFEGTTLLVMELVKGEDLARRLSRGPLPVDEAVDVCRQIAEGLEAAHEAGVVHRDLKPANVCITGDGAVKVLDFGLAKPMTPDAANPTAQTDSFELTAEGTVLGTPTYMSPEQARGKPVDRRTDIWAWGCVFYECLTGARAFRGEAFGELMAAILTHDVDLSKLPAATPAHARRLIERALTKDPRTRLRDIGEARVALAGGEAAWTAAATTKTKNSAMFVWGAAVVGLAWLGATTLGPSAGAAAQPRRAGAMRLTIPQPSRMGAPEVSPDGSRILYQAIGRLWLRDLSEQEARPLPGTEGAHLDPRWSADGTSIAFIRSGESLEILRLGETRPQRRSAVPPKVTSFSWADDDAFLFELGGRSQGIYYVAPGAEEPELLEWIDPTTLRVPHRFNPSFLPGGDAFLLTDSSGDESWIHVASLSSRTTRPLVRSDYRAVYVEPGWLAWTHDGRLLVQPFDKETQRVSGAPHELADGIDSFASKGTSWFSFSKNGTLVYTPMEQPARIEWLDRQGHVLGPADEPRPYDTFRLDRTGRWLAASVITPKDGFRDLWLVDLERRTPQRLTHAPGWESTPSWSPDGKRIAFAADWTGPPTIYVQDVAGGEATEIVPFDNAVHNAGSWTPDGRQLTYSKFEQQRGGGDLWIVDVDTKDRRPLLQTPHHEASPQVSPDGRWIAYTSYESGKPEVYVATFPDLAGSRRVSTDGGDRARWRPGSNELYYGTAARAIAAVTIEELDGRPDPGSESIVIQASEDLAEFDVAPDGERFLVLRRTEDEMRPVSRLIVNWEALVPGGRR